MENKGGKMKTNYGVGFLVEKHLLWKQTRFIGLE